MPFTVVQLITEATKIAGIVSREFEMVTGPEVQDGLLFLNQIIADKTIERDMLPYFTEYNFNAVAGQEAYYIPNLQEIETLTFFINDIRYTMRWLSRKNYWGSSRANNINSLPFNWYFERNLNGGTIYLYFYPNSNYPLQLWGQFRLPAMSFNFDLLTYFDQFYIGYLTYKLAYRYCVNYNFAVPIGVATELAQYEIWISKQSAPLDLTQGTISTLMGGCGLNYGQVNLGFGWTA